jgi:hypothetical protein
MKGSNRENHSCLNIAITIGAVVVSIMIWIFSNTF